MFGFNPALNPMSMSGMAGLSGMSPLGAMGGASGLMMQAQMVQLQSMMTTMLLGLMMGRGMQGGSPSMPGGFNAFGGYGPMGGGGWDGWQGGGKAHRNQQAPWVRPSELACTPLAANIVRDAANHTNNDQGLCLKNVGAVLRRHGVDCGPAPSAYMVLDDLRRSPKMQEVCVPKDKLKNLPPGAVVVWDRGPGLPHGHISIAMGEGREFSGPQRSQMTLSTAYHVFLPKT